MSVCKSVRQNNLKKATVSDTRLLIICKFQWKRGIFTEYVSENSKNIKNTKNIRNLLTTDKGREIKSLVDFNCDLIKMSGKVLFWTISGIKLPEITN